MSRGVDAGHRERARRGVASSPMWNGSGRFAMSSAGYGMALGRAERRRRAGARDRARARRDVTTTAAAQSVSRQQSNSRNGSETHRAARYSSIVSGLPRISAFSLCCACARNATATSPVSVSSVP